MTTPRTRIVRQSAATAIAAALAASTLQSWADPAAHGTSATKSAPLATPAVQAPAGGHLRGIAPRRGPFSPPMSTCAAPKLVFGGGPVISNVEVVQVNWGGSVAPATISLFESWYPLFVSSPSVAWLKEYNANSQTIGLGTYKKNPASTGSWTITPTNTSTSLSETDIGTELVGQIAAGHLPPVTKDAAGNSNTIYMVDFPPGLGLTLQGQAACQAFCAYHYSTQDSSGTTVLYGVHPDMGAGSGCDPQSGQWVCGGSTDASIAASTTHSHELIEAITDPVMDGAWLDQNQGCGEIGDICANVVGSCGNATCQSASVGSITVGGTTLYEQNEWSNAQNDCVVEGPAVACTTNASCAATPNTPICDMTSHTCRPCAAGDCSGATPACETTGMLAGACVACTATNATGCPATTPFCNTATDTCRACTAADCTGAKAVCETTGASAGACVQCDATHTTACVAPTPYCGSSDTCVACTSNAQCTSPNQPICSPAGACTGCTSSSQCPSGQTCNTTTGACAVGTGSSSGGSGSSGSSSGASGSSSGGTGSSGSSSGGDGATAGPGSSSGCGCKVTGAPESGRGAFLVAFAAICAVGARRRRRGTKVHG